MTIAALPTPPSPLDTPADFNSKAFNLLGALPQFVTEANALQADVVAKQSLAATSEATATTKAAAAAASEAVATTKAGEASASAATATTKAGEASTSAATSATKAGEASASAAAAQAAVGNVLVDSGDTTPGKLASKVIAGPGIVVSVQNAGANETLRVEAGTAGKVIFFAGTTAPSGYLKANGAAISRSSYATLFAVIGTTYGAGDGATTFNVPDLRGEFLRALDDGRGVDTGRAVGTAQGDAFQGHGHMAGFSASPSGSSGAQITANVSTGLNGAQVTEPVTNGAFGTPRTATETRPRNVALLACIKY